MRVLVLLCLISVSLAGFDITSCVYTDGDKKYDLSPLSKSDVYGLDGIRQYSYNVRLCAATAACGTKAASVCQSYRSDAYSCGKTATTTVATADNGLIVNVGNGDTCTARPRSSTITLVCDRSVEAKMTYADEDPPDSGSCKYAITISTKHACPTSDGGGGGGGSTGSSGGLSAGSVILIILTSLIVVYIAVGMVYNFKFRDKSGVEMVPNLEFWSDLPSLVKEGFLFVIHGFKKESSYTQTG